ncbi:hypothetical protein CN442_00780 [Bacillus thuringiensis]|uniref:restriction endonuclease subunit S n=1 Tax=Bacillus thuringiensis TaxID=1428 RepID=UPI000BF51351|nr:restriction endonuclease subunit S [Bacillus thuringiensis]PEV93977.1 hypothetical protein CN442_00780 [Bacillus thuringiensis]
MIRMKNLKISELFSIEKGSLQSSKNIEGNYNFITASSDWKTHETFTHNCEALIFAMGASGSLGRTHYINGKFISSDLCFILTPKNSYIGKIDLKFYYYFFNTFREEIVKKTATGTSKKAINLKNFSKLEIPYFDLQYQQLYKEKIENIEYYQQQLNQLLTHNLRDIIMLKEQIFQDAIQGKLIKQDEDDEPASVLLEKIKAEKEQLIKEKRIKKEKPLSQITDEEKSFGLPKSWEWVRFGEVVHSIEAGKSPKCEDRPAIYPEWGVLKVSAVSWGKFNHRENKCLRVEDLQNERYEVHPGDFLMTRANTSELVARSVIVESAPPRLLMSDKILRVKFFNTIDSHYMNIVNLTAFSRDYYAKVATGTSNSMKNVSRDQIKNLLIPLPPFNEQKRIVEKVNQLMILCDELESNIEQSRLESETLMKAVLQEAFTVKEEILN